MAGIRRPLARRRLLRDEAKRRGEDRGLREDLRKAAELTGGASQDQSVYLFAHDLASQPGGDTAPAIKDGPYKLGTLAWGEGKWF